MPEGENEQMDPNMYVEETITMQNETSASGEVE